MSKQNETQAKTRDENPPATFRRGHGGPEHTEEGGCGVDTLCSNLRKLCEESIRKNAEWRERLRGLLEEHERLEQTQQELLDTALQRLDFTVSQSGGQTADLRGLVADYERTLIGWALASAGGRQNRAAALLGIGPTTLNEKIRRLNIPVPRSLTKSGEHGGSRRKLTH